MKYAIVVLAMILLVYLVIDFNSRTADLNRLSADKDTISTLVEARNKTAEVIETHIAYATSEAAVEEYALTNHEVQPGDVLVVPVQMTEITPVPTPEPVVTPPQSSNQERWWRLFFGPTP